MKKKYIILFVLLTILFMALSYGLIRTIDQGRPAMWIVLFSGLLLANCIFLVKCYNQLMQVQTRSH